MAKQGLLDTLGQFNQNPASVMSLGGNSGGLDAGGLGTGGFGAGAAPVPGTPDYRAIDITPLGDNWKPHHVTVLGALADAYLKTRGQAPIFSKKVDEDNLQEAMSNYAADPLDAIKRLARIPGHEGDAAKLYGQYTDDKRQQGNLDRQNQLFDLKLEEIVRDRTANILGAIDPKADDATKQRAIQMAKQYAATKGFQSIADEIPSDGNQMDIDAIRYGEIPVAKQEALKNSDRRLDQADTRIADTESHNKATETQAANNEAGRNIRASQAEAGRQDRHDNPAAKAQPRNVMTKYGVGQVNKDGTKMLLKRGDKYYLYLKSGGANGETNWVPQGEVQPK